jgi:hypothetical protein
MHGQQVLYSVNCDGDPVLVWLLPTACRPEHGTVKAWVSKHAVTVEVIRKSPPQGPGRRAEVLRKGRRVCAGNVRRGRRVAPEEHRTGLLHKDVKQMGKGARVRRGALVGTAGMCRSDGMEQDGGQGQHNVFSGSVHAEAWGEAAGEAFLTEFPKPRCALNPDRTSILAVILLLA